MARLCQVVPVDPIISDVFIRAAIRVKKCSPIKQKVTIKIPLVVFMNLSPFDLFVTTAKP